MKFSQYVVLKEADLASEIDGIFKQTAADIDAMFDQLYQGTAAMVRNAQGQSGGGAALPTQFLSGTLNDLKAIAGIVKSAAQAKRSESSPEINSDPRLPKSENVMVDIHLKDVWEAVSAVQGLGKTGASATGKPVYDFKSTINNVKNMVMQRMEQLRGSVLKAMGMVTDIHGQVGSINKGFGKLNKGITGISKGIEGLPAAMQQRQANPLLSADQVDTADYMVKQLYSIPDELGYAGQVFLVPDKKGARGEKIDVQDELEQGQVINAAKKGGRIMKVKYTVPGQNKAIDTGIQLDLGKEDSTAISNVKQYIIQAMQKQKPQKFSKTPPTNSGDFKQQQIPGMETPPGSTYGVQ